MLPARKYFPGLPILIHAQEYAKGFYERCEFRVSSEPFDEDGIPHVEKLPHYVLEDEQQRVLDLLAEIFLQDRKHNDFAAGLIAD